MKHISLIVILVAYTALASLYSFVVPLGEGPDEPGHATYVFWLAREGRLPVQRATSEASDVPGEGHQPPLAYALAAPLVAWLPRDEQEIDLPGNPRFTWNGGDQPNSAAHGSREFWPWSGAVLAWHLARLVSVACGAATVVLTYLAASALADQRPKTKDQIEASSVIGPWSLVAALAAALVAFNPQFLFSSALITNDALLAALSALLLWLAVRNNTRREPGNQGNEESGNREKQFRSSAVPQFHPDLLHAITLGVVLGLALITKQSALLLAPIALQSIVKRGWRASSAENTLSRVRAVGVQIVLFGAATLLVSGWWFARNWQLYGDPFGLAVFQAEFTTQPFDPRSLDAWIAALKQLHSSFWARFGWMNVRPPGWVLWFFTIIEAAALAGWVRLLLREQGDTETRRHGDKESRNHFLFSSSSLLLFSLPALALAWVVSFALTTGLVAWQGRLLFPALPAIAILLAMGLVAVGRRVEARDTRHETREVMVANGTIQSQVSNLAAWLPLACFAVALWVPFGVIRPAYPPQTLPEQTALAQLGTPVYGRMGLPGDPGAELRGWRIDSAAQPGTTLDVALIWYARGRQNRDWTVFVHLVDVADNIVAKNDHQPRDGAFPLTQWVAGDWIEDRFGLELPASLPPGDYTLRVGLFDETSGERTAVYNEKKKLIGDYLNVGVVNVQKQK